MDDPVRTDDIKQFANAKKYASHAGLAPRAHNSNETVRHGKITKRGPKELGTVLVQVVTGMRRLQARTLGWRLMQRHKAMEKTKIPGKAVIATARKAAVIVWHMLGEEAEFDIGKMADRKPAKKPETVRGPTGTVKEARLREKKKP